MTGAEPVSRPSAPPEQARPGEVARERRPIAALSLGSAVLLLVLAVFPTALLIRWNVIDRFGGRVFEPLPDAKEYVASAQAIRQTGRFFLQIGSYEAPPRYPPGWPLVLAGALEAGVPPERTPEIAGVFDSLHALLIALATVFFGRWLRRATVAEPILLVDLFAGMIAGLGWAATPLAVHTALFAMSDAPAAALLDAMFLLLLVGLFGRRRAWTQAPLFLAAGGLLGLSLAMRPVVLPLVVGPLLLLGVARILDGSRRRLALGLLCFLAGVAIPVAVSATLMSRSGWGAWSWSHYLFWVDQFADPGIIFSWRNLTEGFTLAYLVDPATGEPLSHLEIAVHLFLGIPLQQKDPGLGPGWPALAWLLGGALVLARARCGWNAERRRILLVVAAFATWIVGHVLLFGAYFYPGTRFYLPPLALAWVLLAGAVVHFGRQTGAVSRAAAIAILLATAISVRSELALTLAHPRRPWTELNESEVTTPFREWFATDDDERRELPVPFDPVRAQALGLLSPEALSRIPAWGPLPSTEHTHHLRRKGLIE